ncbi:hypothetical protein HYFRA_00012823 [Hymenoscyphus fraxineus]|uniref:Glucose-methanol-choline oxidoreductase N-terminal domain-containing protein n=1 Tax=Hymenoscyphus fraxineus TaxID=746836 RepID=A0A9N9L6K9_9HELO|nr:hypothetical protein HYFRA_00012823 [Hymenoscyphus fraxineus]
MDSKTLEADYVLVGGGLAGCVLASRLHHAPTRPSVILLEAGPDQHAHPLVTSPLGAPRLHGSELEWNYQTAPQKHLNGRSIYNCGGKLLSGSSAINYGGWTRGHAADYDLWATIVGDQRWSYKGMLPYFRRTERFHDEHGDAAQHGFDGPIHTAPVNRSYPLREPVHQAFIEAGLKQNVDANNGEPLGVAAWTENWRNSVRQPAGVAYDLSGVKVMTSSPVHRVILSESNRATGAEMIDGRRINARKEVIICCGTLRTPQVLMLSGIGPSENLAKIGVPQKVNSPDVGQNFHDHCSLVQFWKLRNPALGLANGAPEFFKKDPSFLNGMPFNWVGTDTVQQADLHDALLADNEVVDAGNINLHSHLQVPRAHIELIIAYSLLGRPRAEYGLSIDGTHISTGVLNLLPTSRGTVTLLNSDPNNDPVINPNYFATHTDHAIMRAGIRRMMQVMETPSMRAIVESETVPSGFSALTSVSSDEDIDARVRQFSATWYHFGGSAAMGKVVDSEFRVMGTEALRVVDASVIPTPIAAHYQACIYAVAEQAADMILG